MTVEAVAFDAFVAENWDFFADFEIQADRTLTSISRQLPADFYSEIQQGVFGSLAAYKPDAELRCRIVIDSNIIVKDAMRVAKGRPSSTDRILSSPFVEVLAPDQILEEVPRILKEKLREREELRVALAHANRLLGIINVTSALSKKALNTAKRLIGAHSPEDVCFLALALDTEAAALLSLDSRAFDAQAQVRRWELSKTVQVVVDRESGALSLLITAKSVEALGQAAEKVFLLILRTVEQIMLALAGVAGAIFQHTAEALSRVPDWAWGVLLGVFVAGVIAYAVNQPFRDWINDKAQRGLELLHEFFVALGEAASRLSGFIHDLVILAWNLLLPLTVALLVCCGVLIRRINGLIQSVESASAGS